jgi:hypothetical protein
MDLLAGYNSDEIPYPAIVSEMIFVLSPSVPTETSKTTSPKFSKGDLILELMAFGSSATVPKFESKVPEISPQLAGIAVNRVVSIPSILLIFVILGVSRISQTCIHI